MTYEELNAEIEEALGDQLSFILDSLVTELLRTEMDPRLICLRIVEELKKFRRETDPVIVLFFAPPLLPSQHPYGGDAQRKATDSPIRRCDGGNSAQDWRVL